MKKGTKVNTIAWAAAAAVLAVAVPINMIFSKVDVKVDVTPYNAYTLSEKVKTSLEATETPVDLYVLYELDKLYEGSDPGTETYMMADMFVSTIRQMSEYDCIVLHEVDIEANPDFVTEHDPENKLGLQSGDILLECNGNNRSVQMKSLFTTNSETGSIEFYGESYIMGAIDYLQKGITPTVYFVTGHGEKDLSEYSYLVSQLENQNYAAKSLDLTAEGSVPEDATEILFAAPKKDISNEELEIVNNYLYKGGNISLLMSPNSDDTVYRNIEKILADYQIGMNYNRVYETDTDYCAVDDTTNEPDKYTIVCEFISDFTTGLQETAGQLNLYMPASRSFYPLDDENSSLEPEPLIQTMFTAASENYGGTTSPGLNEAGMLYLAANCENPNRNNSKLFVAGSADFMDNANMERGYTILAPYLFLTTVSWMDSINSEMLYPTRVQATDYITIPDVKTGNIILVIMIAFPIIIAATGVVVWLRRRNA